MWIALLLATFTRFVSVDTRPPADPPAVVEVAKDPIVKASCWNLVVNAHFGFSRLEQAAFIVRTADGHFSTVEWPASNTLDGAMWVGPLPRGTVAIVHTHPNWMPSPSSVDIKTAARTHVPVYVLTRSRISKTDGSTIEIVTDGEWRPRR